jgi:hypothetical protein
MLRDGNPNEDLLNTDLFYLNNKGVSILVTNIKSVIHDKQVNDIFVVFVQVLL